MAHCSQFGPREEAYAGVDAGRFLEVVSARAIVQGSMIGVDRGEAYHYPGPVGVASLPGLGDHRKARIPARYQMFH